MDKSKTLTFMATHFIDEAIIGEFAKMQNCGSDCIIALNNEKKIFDTNQRIITESLYGVEVTLLLMDSVMTQDEFGLPLFTWANKTSEFGLTQWYNSDYAFYIVRKYFPDYEYYWRIDYDCFFNAPDYTEFFKPYIHDTTDLIVPHLREENYESKWYWIRNTEWLYQNEALHGCLYGILRKSALAIDVCYQARLQQKEIFCSLDSHTHGGGG